MNFDITKSTTSDYSSIEGYKIGGSLPDSATAQEETIWTNPEFSEQWKAFTTIAEYQNALLMKGYWNTGKGWAADPLVTTILKHIDGWGKDTFDDIILNMDVMSMVTGDSYCHIIRENQKDKSSLLLNLKPLNGGRMRHIVGPDGRLIRYELINVEGETQKFDVNEIFHLCYNRMSDQIHGISVWQKLKEIIKADEASFNISNKVMRHQAAPFILWHLKTDDQAKITDFATKIRKIRENYEDLFVPDDENIARPEVIEISPSEILLTWREDLKNKFYRSIGLPQIVPGGTGGTESESKVIYLAFEQLVAQRQAYIQKQIEAQLGLKVVFNTPATMEQLLKVDQQKDAGAMTGIQPSEMNPASAPQG